jgi:hypothetical protein
VVRQTAGTFHRDEVLANFIEFFPWTTISGETRDGLMKGDDDSNLTAASNRLNVNQNL